VLVDSLASPAIAIWSQTFAPSVVPEFADDCQQSILIRLMPKRQMIEATRSIIAVKVNCGAEWALSLENDGVPTAAQDNIVGYALRESSTPRICQGSAHWEVAIFNGLRRKPAFFATCRKLHQDQPWCI
jgi:hypothetical protein